MKQIILLAFAFIFLTGSAAMASDTDHMNMKSSGSGSSSVSMGDHMNMKSSGHDGSMKGMDHSEHKTTGMQKEAFLVEKTVDAYKVSFHVMPAAEGMNHGGSHSLMVKVEQDGKVVQGLVVNSKVIHPNGSAESKQLMAMGDWLSTGYDLGHDGKHQLMVLFKTSDGKKYSTGVYYPNDGS